MAEKRRKRRETFGQIDKLPSGRYRARYVGPDGERHAAPATFDTLTDARAYLRNRQNEIARGDWISPAERKRQAEEAARRAPAERFATYATVYVEQRAGRTGKPLRPKTRAGYLGYITHGLARFADVSVKDITASDVRAWHSERARQGETAAGNEARFMRSVMNLAIDDGIIDRNPVPANLTRSRSGVTHRPPTTDELAAMLDEIPARFRLAVILAAFGGLRLSEWRALRRRDVATVDGRAIVDVSRSAQYIRGEGWHVGPPKSTEGARVVPLPPWAAAEAEQHLSAHVGAFPDSLLFPASGASEYLHDSEWNRAWNVARDAAKVREPVLDETDKPTGRYVAVVREHDLRAYAGTALAQSGATLRDVMRFLGHASMDAAMVYQHTATDRLATLTEQLAMPTRSTEPDNVTPLTGTSGDA